METQLNLKATYVLITHHPATLILAIDTQGETKVAIRVVIINVAPAAARTLAKGYPKGGISRILIFVFLGAGSFLVAIGAGLAVLVGRFRL